MVEVTVNGKKTLINPQAVVLAEASEHFTNRTRLYFAGGLFAEIDVPWEDFPSWMERAGANVRATPAKTKAGGGSPAKRNKAAAAPKTASPAA